MQWPPSSPEMNLNRVYLGSCDEKTQSQPSTNFARAKSEGPS